MKPSRLSSIAIDRLFVRMAGIYGHIWSSQYPDPRTLISAQTEWAYALGDVDLETIGRAINLCLREYERPPTLPQFRRLCKADPMHQPAQLPAPPRHPVAPETIKAHIHAMKDGKRAGFRSVLNGEGYAGYLRDKGAAMAAGIKADEFDRQRLAANGWTKEHEKHLAQHAHRIGYNINSPKT